MSGPTVNSDGHVADNGDFTSQIPSSEEEIEKSFEGNEKPVPADERLSKSDTNVSIAESMSLWREVLFVALLCCAQLTTQAGLSQTLAILHIIGDDYGITNPGELAWFIAGYSLTVGTFILFAGRLGDLFGYKKMVLIGFVWFGLWSLVSGLAVYSNKVLFIFSRVLVGAGPSLTLPNALALLGVTYKPGKRKNIAFSFFGAVAPGGSVIGSVFASLFSLAWWPWTFWSMAVTMLGLAAAGYYILPDDPRTECQQKRTAQELYHELDPVGAIIGVTGLVCVNFAWNQAGVVGWQEAYVYVLLIIGAALFPVFFYYEFRIAKSPLLPFDVVNTEVGVVLACIACGWGSFGIWFYYEFQFFEEIRMVTPLLASTFYVPCAIVGFIAAFSTAWLLGRTTPALIMTLAMVAFCVGSILIATAPVGQIFWAQTFVSQLITPFGMDMSFPAAAIILSNAVPRKHQGIGMSLVNTVVNYSISIALGFAGTIERELTLGQDISVVDVKLRGYRAAQYFGIGLAGLGIVVAGSFLATELWRGRRQQPKDGEKDGKEKGIEHA